MYHIIETPNGQPIILWQSKDKLQKYSINSGRIFNNGIIAKDINKNFHLWQTTPAYISYESVDGSTVVSEINNNTIKEKFITKNPSVILENNNKINIFYIEATETEHNLFVVSNTDNFNKPKLICTDLDFSETIFAQTLTEYIIIFLKDIQLFISYDFKLIMKLNTSSAPIQNSNIINLQNEVSKLKFELHQLEQHHEEFIIEYDKLSSYTGELQEKLRKTRLNLTENNQT